MIEPGMRTPPADVSKAVTADYTRAVNLNARIIASAQLAQQSLYEMCSALKEMRDGKLYKELGYKSFESYCETEHNFTREQGRRMIRAVETYSELGKNTKSTLHFDSTEKYYLLSTLSEPTRTEIADTTDLESVSVRELKAQIAEIQTSREILRGNLIDEQAKNESNKAEISAQKDRIAELEAEVKDLESRPVEVAVQESHEVENIRKAMQKIDLDWGIKYGELEEESNAERMKLLREHDAEITALREDYEKKLSEKPAGETVTVTDDKETYKAYLAAAADAVKRLCAFITSHDDSPNAVLYREKALDLAKMINTTLEDQL